MAAATATADTNATCKPPADLLFRASLTFCRIEFGNFDTIFNVMKTDAPAVASSTLIEPSTRRRRLHRERRRDGMRCLMVELHDTEINALVRAGLLKPETRHDRNAIADALYAHLEWTLLA